MWRVWIGLAASAAVLAALPAGASAQWDDDGPDITRAPSIAAVAEVGARLEAVGAAWNGRGPTSASYSWLRCETEVLWSCDFIDAAAERAYTPAADDLGLRIRALLTVSDRYGRSWAVSAPTAAVVAAPVVVVPPVPVPVPLPAPPPLPQPLPSPAPKLMKPAPIVRIQGYLTRRGARITVLTVRAPKGARISASCTGLGCPRSAPARAVKVTRLWSYEGMLRAGARLVVRVTRPGFIGKHTTIRIRRGKAPARTDRCLYPGAEGAGRVPGHLRHARRWAWVTAVAIALAIPFAASAGRDHPAPPSAAPLEPPATAVAPAAPRLKAAAALPRPPRPERRRPVRQPEEQLVAAPAAPSATPEPVVTAAPPAPAPDPAPPAAPQPQPERFDISG